MLICVKWNKYINYVSISIPIIKLINLGFFEVIDHLQCFNIYSNYFQSYGLTNASNSFSFGGYGEKYDHPFLKKLKFTTLEHPFHHSVRPPNILKKRRFFYAENCRLLSSPLTWNIFLFTDMVCLTVFPLQLDIENSTAQDFWQKGEFVFGKAPKVSY